MTDDGVTGTPPPAPQVDPWGLVKAFADARAEWRSDLDAQDERLNLRLTRMEERLAERLHEFRGDVDEWIGAHMTVHEAMAAEQRVIRDRFTALDLSAAERRGRLSFALKVLELIGREWRLIGLALLALLTFLGNIEFRVVAS